MMDFAFRFSLLYTPAPSGPCSSGNDDILPITSR
jgi:hypothetical protein